MGPTFCHLYLLVFLTVISGLVHVLRKATVPNNSPYRNLSRQIPLETLERAGVKDLEAIISTPGGPDDGGAASSSSDVAEATGSPAQSPPALTGGRMLFAGVAVEPHAEAEDHPDDDAEEDNNSATGAGEGGEPVDGSASTLETSPSGLSADALRKFPHLEHVFLPRYERVTDASGKKLVPVADKLRDPALDLNTPSQTTPVDGPALVPNTPRETPHDDQRFWVSTQAGDDAVWYTSGNLHHVCPCGDSGLNVEHSSANFTAVIASWLRAIYALPNDSPIKSRVFWFKKHYKEGVEYEKFVPRVKHIAMGLLQDAYPLEPVAEGEKSSVASQLGVHIINL